jgi:hypothetical protein
MHAIKACGEVEVLVHSYVIPALYEGEWWVSRSSYFISGVKRRCIQIVGAKVGPRAGPEGVEVMKIIFKLAVERRFPGSPVHSLNTDPSELSLLV